MTPLQIQLYGTSTSPTSANNLDLLRSTDHVSSGTSRPGSNERGMPESDPGIRHLSALGHCNHPTQLDNLNI